MLYAFGEDFEATKRPPQKMDISYLNNALMHMPADYFHNLPFAFLILIR